MHTCTCTCIIMYIPVGGIITGGLSDLIGARAISCVIMMYLAVPTVSIISLLLFRNYYLFVINILHCEVLILQ